MDFHFGRRLLVLGFAIALMVTGAVSVASAIEIQDYPEIRLIYNQEQPGHPGNSWLGVPLISIGDSIEVSFAATPAESIDYVIANLCAYGGGTHDTLYHFQGRDAWISGMAWIPSCSDGASTATMNGPTLWGLRNPSILDESWRIWWDPSDSTWIVQGNLSGTLAAHADEGSLYYGISGGDTLFTFTISGVTGTCCTSLYDVCDHFEFETHQALQADSTYVKSFVVQDGGDCWIDHNPCWYEGHWDARVQVIACDISAAVCDTALTMWPGLVYDGEVVSGDSLWVDTHWTTYAQLDDPAGLGAEFIESNDYTFTFNFDNSGLGPVFGLPDEILNPSSRCLGLNPDLVCAVIDMRKLAHENGNDDIDSLYFDLSAIGDAWADPATVPSGDVNDGGFWFVGNRHYGDIDCDRTGPLTWGGDPFNGWDEDSLFTICWSVLPGQTDEVADVEYIMMWWISDSGDTTFFPVPTHRLAAIDNIIPALTDTSLAEPRDSVDAGDIRAVADMTIAGDDDVLNPASYGYPNPDLVQFTIDLEGLYDLTDVENGGQVWGDMSGIGVWQCVGPDPAPVDNCDFRKMHSEDGTYATDSTGVIAYDPPNNELLDSDSIITGMWVFDDAGNVFCIRSDSLGFPIDNGLPIVNPDSCVADSLIWVEIETDVAFKPGYADVGKPLNDSCGGLYNDRDEIVLHADLGEAFGPSEVADISYVTELYDPFCVGGIRFFDDGTHGSDPIASDKNFTGHARLEVAHTMRNDTTFCAVDTNEETMGFDVLVTDNAGNAAINSACIGIKVDNEPPTMTVPNVTIAFWDDPATFGIDGDKDGDGIVDHGDHLLFEWRAENEPWTDSEIDSVMVDLASIDPSWTGHLALHYDSSGAIYRNCIPSGPCDGFYVNYGSVEDGPLAANFQAWDNAGNATGWCPFTSDLILDNMQPLIDCDSIMVAISGPDTIAAIGDTVSFTYAGPDSDVEEISVDIKDLHYEEPHDLLLTEAGGVWTGSFVVMSGHTTSASYSFDVKISDDVGNHVHCQTAGIAVDNEAPEMNCHDVWVRLWDYVNNVDFRVVNVGDNLTAIYYDDDGDVVRVTADFSNYFSTPQVFEMLPTIHDGPAVIWGYRVDPVPEGNIDQPAGGIGTKVLITAYDGAGNSNSGWFCPMFADPGPPPAPPMTVAAGDDTPTYVYSDLELARMGGLCGDCLPVDTQRPAPVPPDAITFQLLENSNGIANVGDRLRIIVNMGDPTVPGYDMQWASSAVQADISQYGRAYRCNDWDDADMSDCSYLFLTDDGYSAGGEGDGKFSYFFWYQAEDGPEFVEGAPILPGDFNADAGDELTKIRVRSMDDAGNFSDGWTYSDVLVSALTLEPVPVDNQIPEIEPENVQVSFVDNDSNGLVDIGDDVTVTVDATDAEGGPVLGVFAYLYDWGFPSKDMVPLNLAETLVGVQQIYSKTFTVERTIGDYCWNQPDGDVGFENQAADHCPRDTSDNKITLRRDGVPLPEIQILAEDISENWSHYDDTDAPQGHAFLAFGVPLPGPTFYPMIDSWPFMWAWPRGIDLPDLLADTDAPDPVNPTFPFNASGIFAEKLPDGRIGIKMFYNMSPRNMDVLQFYVYGDLATPGVVDFGTYLGAPIPAGEVPTDSFNVEYQWISDLMSERETDYHFGVLAVDDANNTSDPAITWITGMSADSTAPMGYVEAYFNDSPGGCAEEGQPTTIGGDNVYFLGYLESSSQYIDVGYVELWGRIKDTDASSEGDQPGEWKVISDRGEWPSHEALEHAPYRFESDDINRFDRFGDLTECTTFELALVPWDMAGNHSTPDMSQKFTFTYDGFEPILTMFAINGTPSPDDLDLAGQVLIEATAVDQCPMTTELRYRLVLEVMGGDPVGIIWSPLLADITLPVGQPFTYNWDLTNYPQGPAVVVLYVCDQAGNYNSYGTDIHVIDQDAPGGVFASIRVGDLLSHPFYTRLVDGMSIANKPDLGTMFWVKWPESIPFEYYDVGQVKLEYRLKGESGWTTAGVRTSYEDTLSFEDGDQNFLWIGYEFEWDSSIFADNDQIELQATVMDNAGNTQTEMIWVRVSAEAPILALSIPEATEMCGEMRAKGTINVIATELPETNPIDTYFVSYIIKSHDTPDLGDCNPFDGEGWLVWGDTLMTEGGTTSETIWRGEINPDSMWVKFPTRQDSIGIRGLPDGAYDIALVTIDVAGNWSWDKNGDWCVDAGYFAEALANGMGMTIVLQNDAPDIRIRSINAFAEIDEGLLWPEPVYMQTGDQATVTSWTSSTCDIAKVEYFLVGDDIIGYRKLVGVSTEGPGYTATFPSDGGIGQYLRPGALQNGHATVYLKAVVTDLLGNVTDEMRYAVVPIVILDVTPTSAFITYPAPDACVGGIINLTSDVVDDDEVYSVTYQFMPVGGSDWTTIATTRPHDGDPWDTDGNGDDIEWSTDLLPDGYYLLRAVSKDANLNDDPNPPTITVHVDNTPPVASFILTPSCPPMGETPADVIFIGGSHVEFQASASDDDGCGIDHVTFYFKSVDADLDSASIIATDYEAPFAFDWTGPGFTGLVSGWYNVIVEAVDAAGNSTFETLNVYVDQWAPDGDITTIQQAGMPVDQTPDGSNFWGVLTITGVAKDDVPVGHYLQKLDSGVTAAQFQYKPVPHMITTSSAESDSIITDCSSGWIDLGEVIVGPGPDYAINWDTGMLVPGEYYLRLVGVDCVGNRADVDCEPALDVIQICIVDQIPPKAIIAGVDSVSGFIWATTDTHGQEDIQFVRFEYKRASALVTAEWTVIGEIDTTFNCSGLYGVPWHFASLDRNTSYLIRAVAYDDDYDVVEFPGLFDQNPAQMLITIGNLGQLTMAESSQIPHVGGLTHWGNLDDFDKIGVKVKTAQTAVNAPTAIVIYDDDPQDHFNTPWAKQLSLEHPDDLHTWVDAFSLEHLGNWGNVTIIATYYNPAGSGANVGAKVDIVNLFKVTDAEGTKGDVTQDGMTVNIPAGAVWFGGGDGLVIVEVPPPVADPSLEAVTPVGNTVMLNFINHGYESESDYHDLHFINGMKATVTLAFTEPNPENETVEMKYRPARWCPYCGDWEVCGIEFVSIDDENNTVTFRTDRTGAFAIVSGTTLRVTTPTYYPGCPVGEVKYTGRFPMVCSTIEDILFGIDRHEIKITIDGPGLTNKVLDNVTIWYHNDAPWPGVRGGYDEISHMLCIWLDPEWAGDDYWHMRGGQGPWMGLPGGDYTITIAAMNKIGDVKTVVDHFTVDVTPPTVGLSGDYVGFNPNFTFSISDLQSGVDLQTLFVDVYAVNGTTRTFLGTVGSSGLTFDAESGTVTVFFGDMISHLGEETSIDLIVYDGNVYAGSSYADSLYIYNACSSCRYYLPWHGVADCAGNHANPVWRRFTIDAMGPVMTLISDPNACEIRVRVTDLISGIAGKESFTIKVDGLPLALDKYEYLATSNDHEGILTINAECDARTIEITAYDKAGNFTVLVINHGTQVVQVNDVKSYPNPFDPWKNEVATIGFDLTKGANVTIKILDFAGSPVKTVFTGWLNPGLYNGQYIWDGSDENGNLVASGAYIGFVKIDDGMKVITKDLKIGVAKRCED